MAAAKFIATLKFAGNDGARFSYTCTVSDVAAAFYIFSDGQAQVTLPSNHGVLALYDVVLSSAGTDTGTATIFVNGKVIGDVIMNDANLGTNFSRQLMGNPIRVAASSTLRFVQVAR